MVLWFKNTFRFILRKFIKQENKSEGVVVKLDLLLSLLIPWDKKFVVDEVKPILFDSIPKRKIKLQPEKQYQGSFDLEYICN